MIADAFAPLITSIVSRVPHPRRATRHDLYLCTRKILPCAWGEVAVVAYSGLLQDRVNSCCVARS